MQITKKGSPSYKEGKETNRGITKEREKGLLYSKEDKGAKPNNRNSKQKRRRTPILRREC